MLIVRVISKTLINGIRGGSDYFVYCLHNVFKVDRELSEEEKLLWMSPLRGSQEPSSRLCEYCHEKRTALRERFAHVLLFYCQRFPNSSRLSLSAFKHERDSTSRQEQNNTFTRYLYVTDKQTRSHVPRSTSVSDLKYFKYYWHTMLGNHKLNE